MKKIFLLLLLCLAYNTSFSQEKKINHALELGLNGSLLCLNGEIGYRLNVKKFSFTVRYGYGQIGKKKFVNTALTNAYGFWKLGYFSPLNNFTHNFIGSDVGVGLGGIIRIKEKHSLILSANLDYYFLKDYYKSPDISAEISSQNFSIGFEVDYYYKINDLLSLKFGVSTPLMTLLSFRDFEPYNPSSMKFPMAGFEPYLSVGVQFNLSKKTL